MMLFFFFWEMWLFDGVRVNEVTTFLLLCNVLENDHVTHEHEGILTEVVKLPVLETHKLN